MTIEVKDSLCIECDEDTDFVEWIPLEEADGFGGENGHGKGDGQGEGDGSGIGTGVSYFRNDWHEEWEE